MISVVFSSTLVLSAAMIVHNGRGKHIKAFEGLDYMACFQKAQAALRNLGNQSRLAARCWKYLERLLQVATPLDVAAPLSKNTRNSPPYSQVPSKVTFYSTPAVPQRLPFQEPNMDLDVFSFPLPEYSEISPTGFDMGPFLSETAWDTIL